MASSFRLPIKDLHRFKRPIDVFHNVHFLLVDLVIEILVVLLQI